MSLGPVSEKGLVKLGWGKGKFRGGTILSPLLSPLERSHLGFLDKQSPAFRGLTIKADEILL